MTKTPDAIKTGLPLYAPEEIKEILQQKWTIHLQEKLYRSAFVYIQQLESTVSENEKVVAELSGKIGQLEADNKLLQDAVDQWELVAASPGAVEDMARENTELLKKVEQLQAERDAAIRDVRKWCCTCKHCAKEVRETPCNSCRRNGQGGTEECWEWRGVQKEE